jgi:hypothetical protein
MTSPPEHFKFKFDEVQPPSSIAASTQPGTSQSDSGTLPADSHVSTRTGKRKK